MHFYKDLEKRKEAVREYIKNHQTATFKEIKLNLKTKINKVYAGGIKEAYIDAGVKPARNFIRKSPEEKRQIILDYIRNNPSAGGQIIRRDTKINFFTFFKSTEEAFKAAQIAYPRNRIQILRKRDITEKKEIAINIIKNNPFIRVNELIKLSKISIYKLFDNIAEIYKEAGINYLGKGAKRRISKQKQVIEYIKNNPIATQREINKACHTHVQLIFKNGIFESYEKAGITFPFERLNVHGVLIKEIKENAEKFEIEIANKLAGYGLVNRLVKTRRGFADIILKRKGKKVAIELKNYKCHEISISQVKQLNKYLEDIDLNLGFLICLKKPKKDTFLIGKNKIFVITESELNKIPDIIDKGAYFNGLEWTAPEGLE